MQQKLEEILRASPAITELGHALLNSTGQCLSCGGSGRSACADDRGTCVDCGGSGRNANAQLQAIQAIGLLLLHLRQSEGAWRSEGRREGLREALEIVAGFLGGDPGERAQTAEAIAHRLSQRLDRPA